jgi:hypothetical protein
MGYPTIAKGVQHLIDTTVALANDGDDPRRAQYKEFVETAIAVANQPKVTDPSSKGLYWYLLHHRRQKEVGARPFRRRW